MDQPDQQLQAPWNFSVIVLPDTQFYSQTYPAVFNNQTQWIVDTVASLNTVFVTHEGDLVNTYSSTTQWNNANSSMSKLDGNVPWAVLPGNHDGANVGGAGENLNSYNSYFPRSRFSGQPWYGGAYNNVNSNNFELFSGGADDYLIFHFQYHPSDAVLEWANTTIANCPNRRVIVTTHDYMNVDGSRSAEGDHIWNSFVAAHADQVFLVLCGHNHGEARRTDIVNGHAVYQLLADYQEGYPNGGNGWLRVLDFRPAEDKIYVRSFSPYVNQYQTDADSQFTLDYDMTSQQQITVDVQSPNDGITTMDNMPDFKFTVTHTSQLTFNCSLWLQNGTSSKVFASKDGVVNGSLTTLTPSYPVPNGVWQWWINCTASTMNGVSAKRSVTISVFRGDKTFTSTWDGSTRTYWLDLPDNFDTSAPTPLVFFLHGFGGSRYSYSDPAKYPVLRQVFQNHTWIVAAVECRTVNGYQNWYAEPSRQDITDVLVQLRNSYNIDSSHVHIMGNSMGGGGALKYAMFNNGAIASLVDIHGVTNFTQFYNEASTYRASLEAAYGGTPSQAPGVYANESALGNEQRFSHTPVMMLHGTADTAVNVSHSRNLNLSLSVLGYAVKYVEVPGVDHDASVLVSGREMEILSWFEDHPLTSYALIVVRGSDNRIYWRSHDSTLEWGLWKALPGLTSDSPAATVCNNELHIVVLGTDGRLYDGYVDLSTNVFSGWTMLDGVTYSAPTLTSNSTTLSLVVRGGDNRIYYRFYGFSPRGWGSWMVVSDGVTCDTPAAALLGSYLHILVRGLSSTDAYINNTLYYNVISPGGEAGWKMIDGLTFSRPVLAADQTASTIYSIVRGTDNRIYWRAYDVIADSWGNWNVTNGFTGAGPGATVADNKLCLVVLGTDGMLYNGSIGLWNDVFNGWTMVDGLTPSAPTLTG